MNKSIAIGLGITEFPFSGAQAFWRWVDLCEQGGIDSLWQTDRLISREPILECMTLLAALAGRTRRLKFGVNVVSLAMRDPVLLAKQCATSTCCLTGGCCRGLASAVRAGRNGRRCTWTPPHAVAKLTRRWRLSAGCGQERRWITQGGILS